MRMLGPALKKYDSSLPFDEAIPKKSDITDETFFEKFQSVFITSGTLSPIELYPRLLSFNPVCIASLPMTLTRDCLRPMVITRGADQQAVSTKFDMRDDPGVILN